MRLFALTFCVALVPCAALAQRLGCDPVGYPPDACGRLPDHCGGFVDLGPCPTPPESQRVEVHDCGVWTIGGAPIDTPSFGTAFAGSGADSSWLYVAASQPLEALRARAQYPGGRAAWAYPEAVLRSGAITWRALGSPPPNGGAWTAIAEGAARGIGDALPANGVLLHGGTVRFLSPLVIRDGALVSAQGEHSLWVVGRSGFEERLAFGRQHVLVRAGDHAALRQRLFEELVQRGLRDGEANALLAARAETLLSGERSHVLYFLPRERIDRAQPLRIEPAPDVLIRVRLVDDYR
jgi:hypothetical protein